MTATGVTAGAIATTGIDGTETIATTMTAIMALGNTTTR
jgi:hypothetical protein